MEFRPRVATFGQWPEFKECGVVVAAIQGVKPLCKIRRACGCASKQG